MPTSDETWTLAEHDVPVYRSGEGGRALILIHEVWGSTAISARSPTGTPRRATA